MQARRRLTRDVKCERDNQKVMKAIGYIVLAAAASVSLVFVQALMPTGLGATVFLSAWLLLPYAVLALTLVWAKERPSAAANVAVAVMVGGGGLLFLTDVIFLHPDPQGGIAVLFTPIYQGVGIVMLLPICLWLFGKMNT